MGFLDTVKSKATGLKGEIDKKMAGAHIAHSDWGSLEKAKLVIYDKVEKGKRLGEFVFMFNPTSVKFTKSVKLEDVQTQGTTRDVRWKSTDPVKVEFGDLWFDTYETRKNVRDEYIKKLEELLDYYDQEHHVPCVQFVWGEYLTDSPYFYVQGLTVDYTMFLPTGMPVRAKVSLNLVEASSIQKQQQENPKQSPDHAKIYTVRRGDTLQAIAQAEYADAREWRRIATSNGIDDPMGLKPGMKLLVPPILK